MGKFFTKHPIQTYIKHCPICQKIFSYQKYPSQEKEFPKQTCSRHCSYKFRSQKLSGKFVPNKYNEKDFSRWKYFHCKFCGKEIFEQQSTPRVFCSIKCKADWQKLNLHGENNPNWKPIKSEQSYLSVPRKIRRMLISKRKVCERCGASRLLQVHHIDRNRKHNDFSNLKLLCKSCHATEHENMGDLASAKLIMVHPQT